MSQITSTQLLEKQFKTKRLGGYDPVDVIATIREAAEAIEDLTEENTALKAQVEQISHDLEQYQKLQESLNAALISAQHSAEQTREAAKREAEAMQLDAKAKSKEILIGVRQAIRKTEEELSLAQHEKEQFLISYETLLTSQLRWVQSQSKAPEKTFTEIATEEIEAQENQ